MAEAIEAALDIAGVRPPDILISDFRLPDQRSGLEAIATLCALLGDELPSLLMTGDTAADRIREAAGLGVAVLQKPVPPHELHRNLVMLR